MVGAPEKADEGATGRLVRILNFPCPRCGEQHGSYLVHLFRNRPSKKFTHWSMCPTLWEPFFLKLRPSPIHKLSKDDKRFVRGTDASNERNHPNDVG